MNPPQIPPGMGKKPDASPCPICGKPLQPRFHPFCSRRCADVDLHRWLGGSYRIATAERPGNIDDGSEAE